MRYGDEWVKQSTEWTVEELNFLCEAPLTDISPVIVVFVEAEYEGDGREFARKPVALSKSYFEPLAEIPFQERQTV